MKTLYNTVQQYESILDPDQDQVMSRMTDEMIRQRIREYCTYDSQKYKRNELWLPVRESLKITKIDKDEKGWYVETESPLFYSLIFHEKVKSFYDLCQSKGQQINKQEGFLIKDTEIYFRWRKHIGGLYVDYAPNLESTDGLPGELDGLRLYHACEYDQRFDVRNKIKVIELEGIKDIKISGNGCKNVIIHPNDRFSTINIKAPSSVEIHHPRTNKEYFDLRQKLLGY